MFPPWTSFLCASYCLFYRCSISMFLWLPVHFPVLSPPSQPWRGSDIGAYSLRVESSSQPLPSTFYPFSSLLLCLHHQPPATYNQGVVVSLSLSLFSHPSFQVGPFCELQIEPSVLPENTFSHFRSPPPHTRSPWAMNSLYQHTRALWISLFAR